MNKEINKTSLITIFLYIFSFIIVYTLAYPLYSGRGINLLHYLGLPESNVVYEITKGQELQKYKLTAEEFRSNAMNQAAAYQNIPPEKKDRINIAIPQKLDLGRLINDLDKISDNSSMKSSAVTFAKAGSSSQTNDTITTYRLSYNLKGKYQDFKNYISVIENNLQLLNIQKLSFEPDKSLEAGKPFENYQFSVEAEAYELK